MSDNASTTLYEAIFPCLPQNAATIVKNAIDEFGSLPGLKEWRPQLVDNGRPNNYVNHEVARTIIGAGISLVQLRSCSIELLRKKIANEVLKHGTVKAFPVNGNLSTLVVRILPIDESLLAEVHAVALLVFLKADNLEKLNEDGTRVPDFKTLFGANPIEIEVVRSETKNIQNEIQEVARQTAQDQISELDPNIHIVLHAVYPIEQNEMGKILDTVKKIETGKIIENKGKWQLRTYNLNEEFTTKPEDRPTWWPNKDNAFTVCCASRIIGSKPRKPRIQVEFPVLPNDSWISSVKNKAERFQGSGENIFIIVVDVQNLPKAFQQFKENLPTWFNNWQHVSGVLLFKNAIGFNLDYVSWEYDFIPNPNAKHSAPIELLRVQSSDGKPNEIKIPLVKNR